MRHAPFDGVEVFLSIVRQGSLRAAARALGIGPPAVSYQLKALEDKLGVSLLVRTTRSVELTQAGQALLAKAAPAMDQLGEALEEARGIGGAKTGRLRITLPWSAYKIAIAPRLCAFQRAYPDVQLEMSFDEGLVDIIRDGFHAGIRLGDRLAPGMVAVRLTPALETAYSAAPAYLSEHGEPHHPEELMQHSCIRYRFSTTKRIASWRFMVAGQEISVDPRACLVFDRFQTVIEAAKTGHGIGWSLRRVIEDELERGELKTVLDAYGLQQPPFFLYYPDQNRRLELLRLFIDFFKIVGASR